MHKTVLFPAFLLIPLFSIGAQSEHGHSTMKAIEELCFEENKGQVRSEKGDPVPFVLFRTHMEGADMYITENGVSYVFTRYENEPGEPDGNRSHIPPKKEYDFARADAGLAGATILRNNIRYEDPLPGEYNYYINGDSHTGIKRYAKVTIQNVYPSIDWVWHISPEGKLKYDFIVRPGGDPKKIKLLYHWADISLDGSSLVVSTPVGKLTEGSPVSFCRDKTVRTSYQLEKNSVS